ncbi:hypothetical protein LAG90_09165 [Marinilongibacter aquaticus]|uniref:hypothetical protein n=1 Tax=Marinilongibacter aquaticus TaxID=2975157 RepID=UPI0021BD9657|nr:hypothetical protein [Marinilongibacter aquaticus]UBM60804.1 hypothetical protein LAG90_09165 [Marinilongibacter aquaticus]
MRKQNLRKPTVLLIFAGIVFMSFTLLTGNFFGIPSGLDDFIKGLGVAFMISALFVQRKLERKAQH